MSDISGSDQPTKIEPKGSGTVFDKEIGDDWGEAFEADEFMQTPEEGVDSDFFLDDDASQPVAVKAKDVEGDLAPSPSAPSFFVRLLSLRSFFLKINTSFRSLSLLYRTALPVLLLAIIVGSWIFFAVSPTSNSDSKKVVGGQVVDAPTVPNNDESQDSSISSESVGVSNRFDELLSGEPKKERQIWRLPPFLIAAKDNTKGDDIFFVEADISLVFLLSEGESLPTTQGVLVRDIIYQFFTNSPIYELRRYSLARGEMNRKLRGWIEKQWSDRKIATIVFNRYQVL